MLCSIASSVVYTQRPGNHVAEQSNQEQQRNCSDKDAIFLAAHNHYCFNQTGSCINFVSWDTGTDAKARK